MPVGGFPTSLAVGDFNGDGHQDLAVASGGSNTVTILLGDGRGGFRQAPGSPVAAGGGPEPGAGPESLAVGDFDGDGHQDLAVANVPNNVTILLGDGRGGFRQAPGGPVAVGDHPVDLAVGDFDGDGHQDLAVANLDSSNVTILLGDGRGGFCQAPGSPVHVGGGPDAVAVADFNGDGHQDLAVVNFDPNNVTILLGDGRGGFRQASGSPVAVGGSPGSLAVGDFNGDGHLDLAVAHADPNNVIILLGDGHGRFHQAPGTPVAVGKGPGSLAVGDFNEDGRPDLAVANFNSNDVTILLNTGRFAPGGLGFRAGAEHPSEVAGVRPAAIVSARFGAGAQRAIPVRAATAVAARTLPFTGSSLPLLGLAGLVLLGLGLCVRARSPA